MNLLALFKTWLARRMLLMEFCHRCGHRVNQVWTADDWLWKFVRGDDQACRCIRCFDIEAQEIGLFIRWVPQIDNPANSILNDRVISVEEASFMDALPLTPFPPRRS